MCGDMTGSTHKIVSTTDELESKLSTLKRPLVFTNGCFDILHRGHVAYLEEAATLGLSLVVGVNSDASIQRLRKSLGRPINPLEDRLAVLAALQSVDLVIMFDEDTPLQLICRIKPDVLVKGGDWQVDQIVGKDAVERHGGEVRSIPIRYKRSTTELIGKIQSRI